MNFSQLERFSFNAIINPATLNQYYMYLMHNTHTGYLEKEEWELFWIDRGSFGKKMFEGK